MIRPCLILAACAGLFAPGAAEAQTLRRTVTLLVSPEGGGTAFSGADGAIVSKMQQSGSPCPTQFANTTLQQSVVTGAQSGGVVNRGGALKNVWRVNQAWDLMTAEPPGTSFCVCTELPNEPCSGGSLTTITKLEAVVQSSPREWVDCNNNNVVDAADCQ